MERIYIFHSPEDGRAGKIGGEVADRITAEVVVNVLRRHRNGPRSTPKAYAVLDREGERTLRYTFEAEGRENWR